MPQPAASWPAHPPKSDISINISDAALPLFLCRNRMFAFPLFEKLSTTEIKRADLFKKREEEREEEKNGGKEEERRKKEEKGKK